jgi:hypothetical protein
MPIMSEVEAVVKESVLVSDENSWILLKTNYDKKAEIVMGIFFASFALLGMYIT